MEANTKMTTLRDYIRILFKHKRMIVAVFIIVMVTVYIALQLKTPVYEAQVKILVSALKETEAAYYRELWPGRNTSVAYTQSEIVKSRTVIERAVRALGLYQRPLDYEKNFASKLKSALIDYRLNKLNSKLEELTPEQKQAFLFNKAVEDLEQNIEVKPIRETDVFTINVRDFNPVAAAIIANTVSRSYVIFDLEQQIVELQLKYGEKHSTVTQLNNYIKQLYKTLDGKRVSDIEALGPASVKIIEQAQIAPEPVGMIGRRLGLIFAFFTSIFLGVMIAFISEYLDQTFKSPQDIESYLNIPFLGSIPKRKSKDKLLIRDADQITKYTQSYQNLSDQIFLLIKDKNLKSLLITDAEALDETAAVIANIGSYLAHKAAHKVLVIDANLRNPSISNVFNISNSPGLTDVLEEKISFEDAVQDLGSNLYVLPAGQTALNPTIFLSSSMMSDVMKKAREQYEIVFVNCADIKNFADGVILSSITDGVALVVNEGKVRRQVVKEAITPLEQKKINIIGVILTNRKYVIPEIIYKRV